MTEIIAGVSLHQIIRAEIVLAWVAIIVGGLFLRRLIRPRRAVEFGFWFYLLGGIGSSLPSFLPAFWTEMGPSRLPDNPGVALAYWFILPLLSSLFWLPGWILAFGWFRHDPEASRHLQESALIGFATGVALGILMTTLLRRLDRLSAASPEQA